MKRKTGTKEWSEKSLNLRKGCEHNCRYCYAAYNAICRYKHVADREAWQKPTTKKTIDKPKLVDGTIMFPTTHDIMPEHADKDIEYLKTWLELGNKFLIVSKPHRDVINKMVLELASYRKQITFRFSIGSMLDSVLLFWEPNAPSYYERQECLEMVYFSGFGSSVSCEPYLDYTVEAIIKEALPYVTDTIWLGKMNEMEKRIDTSNWIIPEMWDNWRLVKAVQTDEYIKYLYEKYKDNPKIRWKDSIKEVLGLAPQEKSE